MDSKKFLKSLQMQIEEALKVMEDSDSSKWYIDEVEITGGINEDVPHSATYSFSQVPVSSDVHNVIKELSKRYSYILFNDYIYDALTGRYHDDLKEITDLLNKESDRADRNAEKLDKYLYKKDRFEYTIMAFGDSHGSKLIPAIWDNIEEKHIIFNEDHTLDEEDRYKRFVKFLNEIWKS